MSNFVKLTDDRGGLILINLDAVSDIRARKWYSEEEKVWKYDKTETTFEMMNSYTIEAKISFSDAEKLVLKNVAIAGGGKFSD